MMRIVNLKSVGGFDGLRRLGGVYCGRPSSLGNPFEIGPDGGRNDVIEKYRRWLYHGLLNKNREIIEALEALTTDSILGCWCKPKRCHCDVIIAAWEWWTKERVGLRTTRA